MRAGGAHVGGIPGAFGSFRAGANRFGNFNRFRGAPFDRFRNPGGVGAILLYDGAILPYEGYETFYGGYAFGPECSVERRPFNTLYGLGWRNVVIC
jgi:hypothetical protein